MPTREEMLANLDKLEKQIGEMLNENPGAKKAVLQGLSKLEVALRANVKGYYLIAESLVQSTIKAAISTVKIALSKAGLDAKDLRKVTDLLDQAIDMLDKPDAPNTPERSPSSSPKVSRPAIDMPGRRNQIEAGSSSSANDKQVAKVDKRKPK